VSEAGLPTRDGPDRVQKLPNPIDEAVNLK